MTSGFGVQVEALQEPEEPITNQRTQKCDVVLSNHKLKETLGEHCMNIFQETGVNHKFGDDWRTFQEPYLWVEEEAWCGAHILFFQRLKWIRRFSLLNPAKSLTSVSSYTNKPASGWKCRRTEII